MLVLTRKSGESIFIDGKIKISVVDVKRGAVKLGIEAPNHVLVYRGEIFEKILEENKKAAAAGISDLDGIAGLLSKKKKTIRQ